MAEDIEIRRKRLLHRSLYTGMKEVDILLGSFARRHLQTFTEVELDQYEALLENYDDPQIYAGPSAAIRCHNISTPVL
jgi:succinate dehydrogenase flavin-adding protein (antitoxin of CptAB toxin-antitoxin module)